MYYYVGTVTLALTLTSVARRPIASIVNTRGNPSQLNCSFRTIIADAEPNCSLCFVSLWIGCKRDGFHIVSVQMADSGEPQFSRRAVREHPTQSRELPGRLQVRFQLYWLRDWPKDGRDEMLDTSQRRVPDGGVQRGRFQSTTNLPRIEMLAYR